MLVKKEMLVVSGKKRGRPISLHSVAFRLLFGVYVYLRTHVAYSKGTQIFQKMYTPLKNSRRPKGDIVHTEDPQISGSAV
jgi:hypothetical protein